MGWDTTNWIADEVAVQGAAEVTEIGLQEKPNG